MANDRLELIAFIDTKNIDKQLQGVVKKAKDLKFNVDTKSLKDTNSSLGQILTKLTDIPKKVAGWMLMSTAVASFFGSISDGLQTIFALDSAMTNINMTMDLTSRQQEELIQGAFDTAQQYNNTAEAVLRITQIYSNLSETVDTLNQKVETTIALANITQSSATDMADAIQGMGFQFDVAADNIGHVSDVMVSIARTTGVDLSKSIQSVSQAVSTAGSVAADSGFSLESFAATIQTVQEQSRLAGSTIASGLVTVLSRMSRVTDETGQYVSDLDEMLAKQGINLRDSQGEFRNRFTVLQEIAKAQENWNSTTREAIAFELAG